MFIHLEFWQNVPGLKYSSPPVNNCCHSQTSGTSLFSVQTAQHTTHTNKHTVLLYFLHTGDPLTTAMTWHCVCSPMLMIHSRVEWRLGVCVWSVLVSLTLISYFKHNGFTDSKDGPLHTVIGFEKIKQFNINSVLSSSSVCPSTQHCPPPSIVWVITVHYRQPNQAGLSFLCINLYFIYKYFHTSSAPNYCGICLKLFLIITGSTTNSTTVTVPITFKQTMTHIVQHYEYWGLMMVLNPLGFGFIRTKSHMCQKLIPSGKSRLQDYRGANNYCQLKNISISPVLKCCPLRLRQENPQVRTCQLYRENPFAEAINWWAHKKWAFIWEDNLLDGHWRPSTGPFSRWLLWTPGIRDH